MGIHFSNINTCYSNCNSNRDVSQCFPSDEWRRVLLCILLHFPSTPAMFMTYGPLFLSNADYLTTKYKEFQVQISIGIIIGVYLVISVFSIAYFSNSVLSACVANYEANYEGVTCTMFV